MQEDYKKRCVETCIEYLVVIYQKEEEAAAKYCEELCYSVPTRREHIAKVARSVLDKLSRRRKAGIGALKPVCAP